MLAGPIGGQSAKSDRPAPGARGFTCATETYCVGGTQLQIAVAVAICNCLAIWRVSERVGGRGGEKSSCNWLHTIGSYIARARRAQHSSTELRPSPPPFFARFPRAPRLRGRQFARLPPARAATLERALIHEMGNLEIVCGSIPPPGNLSPRLSPTRPFASSPNLAPPLISPPSTGTKITTTTTKS